MQLIPVRVVVPCVFVAMIAAIALVPALAADSSRSDRVAVGVHALGRDLSNLRSDELAAALKIASEEFTQRSLQVHRGEFVLPTKLADLGVTVDLNATAQSVLEAGPDDVAGRVGKFLGRNSERTVAPAISIDPVRLDALLDRLASASDSPPQDARLSVSPNGIAVLPGQNGELLDRDETARRIRRALSDGAREDVTAAVREAQPAVNEAEWRQAADLARRILAGPIILRHGQQSWSLGAADIAKMLVPEAPKVAGAAATVRWDELALRQSLERVSREVSVPSADAQLEWRDGSFKLIVGSVGRQVDMAATIAAVESAAISASRQAMLVITPAEPALGRSDWAEATEAANRAARSPLKLTLTGRSWSLAPADIAAMITFTRSVPGAPYSASLDRPRLAAFITDLAEEIDRPARDARFKWIDGKMTPVAESEDGLAVDVPATVAAVETKLFTEQRAVPIVVAVAKPKRVTTSIEKLSFPDAIMDASTSFAGAIPEKVHNIQLAASRLNGTLVAPGALFSFNESVGPTTLAAGYRVGFGITLQGNQPITVPSVAGGICQVTTTLFQAVFWAGYPIVQRQGHLYWISNYGTPPRGALGLDATVDDPYLDFKFRNVTPNWLLVEASADGTNVRFALRGRKPDWEVKVDKPVISGVVKAAEAWVRQEDPTLPRGTEVVIEHAEDGFTAKVRREVHRGDQIIDVLDVVSTYRPARNVVLVGTKPPTPSPTPVRSATASPTTTPLASPSAAGSATRTVSPLPAVSATPAAATPTVAGTPVP